MKLTNRTGEGGNLPIASRFDLVIFAALGCLNILLATVLSAFTNIPQVFIALIALLLYVGEVTVLNYKRRKKVSVMPVKSIHDFLNDPSSVFFKETALPLLAFDARDIVLWHNEAMSIRISDENLVGRTLSDIFGDNLASDIFDGNDILYLSRRYRPKCFKLSESDAGLYILLLEDITKLKELEKNYYDERVAVAYIAIDNIEDVLQYVHDSVADSVTRVTDKLREWAASIGALFRPYDNEKFIMLFDSAHLQDMVKDKFSILDKIREERVGDSVSITVSIGIASAKGTLAERETVAKDAIDIALQRGGDQVVYKTENSTEYYGGKTKAIYKRSNVRTRTFSNQLTALIARKDNVLIMGHKYGDFDSLGAAVGAARLAMLCGAKTNVAVDMRDKNLAPFIEMLQNTDMYSQVFVDNAEALDLVSTDTLLVLVDHHIRARAQFEDVARKVKTIAVIDHHRKLDNAEDPDIKLALIEPSASSACELVTEMLESAVSSRNLLKAEADILLAGILLDTKQLTRNTGTRTFGAAQYLRGAGADPSDVYSMFKTSASDLSKESRFHTNITIYRGNIAISSCDGDTDASYRIIASKAADKMLTLKGIDAAFALVRIGEQIHISGRSNGNINVQLILEALGGGGHFDVAGAQTESDSIIKVLQTLKDSIDAYIDKNQD